MSSALCQSLHTSLARHMIEHLHGQQRPPGKMTTARVDAHHASEPLDLNVWYTYPSEVVIVPPLASALELL